VAVLIVVQFRLDLEPLARKSCIQRLRAGDAVHAAPGQPHRTPHSRLRRIGHADRAVQVIDVDIECHRARGIHARHHRDRPVDRHARVLRWRDLDVVQPDVFSDRTRGPRRAAARGLGDQIALFQFTP
jgi:hypothetical protein